LQEIFENSEKSNIRKSIKTTQPKGYECKLNKLFGGKKFLIKYCVFRYRLLVFLSML